MTYGNRGGFWFRKQILATVGVLRFARAAANFTAKIGRWPKGPLGSCLRA
jgi:hypothetical protein